METGNDKTVKIKTVEVKERGEQNTNKVHFLVSVTLSGCEFVKKCMCLPRVSGDCIMFDASTFIKADACQ